MPVVSSLDHLPTDGEFYSNNCVDGHCIGCGECCTDLLPTTRREIVRLRDYAKKHQLKEHRLPAGAAAFAGGIVALAVALLHRLADEIDKRRGRR